MEEGCTQSPIIVELKMRSFQLQIIGDKHRVPETAIIACRRSGAPLR
jgi:hypothetical protein